MFWMNPHIFLFSCILYMSRPLTDEEIERVLTHLEKSEAKYALRAKMLIIVGIYTGFRISELLSIKIEDLLTPKGEVKDELYVARKNMKGKKRGRTVPLHRKVKEVIEEYINTTGRHTGPLFLSQKGENKPICSNYAWELMADIFDKCEIYGKLGTHTMRKTLAKKVYERTGRNLLDTQQALGHISVGSTQHYLQFDNEKVKRAFLD
jgi:integrase